MLIHISSDDLEPEFKDKHWLLNRLELLHIDYATNSILGSIDDKEVEVFKFNNFGWINDNRNNTYSMSTGSAGIIIKIISTKN